MKSYFDAMRRYFVPAPQHHSDDPGNPAITTRVLTIMLAEEY